MNLRPLAFVLFAASLSFSAAAAPYACPDLATAVQVNACPTEDELKHTYEGFCSDDAKAYANQTDVCPRYSDYRQMKNVARWESKDGVFDGYVSCDLPPARLKALQATGMKIVAQGKLNKVVCNYPGDIAFTYRTRSACAIVDAKTCAAAAANCLAACD